MNTNGAKIYPTRAKQVTTLIGCPHLELVQGEGYWYFIYDDQRGKYETRSVQVLRLSHLTMVEWIAEGKDFVATMEPQLNMDKITATFFLGKQSMPAEAPEVDVTLSDEALFDSVAFQMSVKWASTGGVPHHLAAMRERGMVSRRNPGFVRISGNGWNVVTETPEYLKMRKEAMDKSDWPTLTELCMPTTVWHLDNRPFDAEDDHV